MLAQEVNLNAQMISRAAQLLQQQPGRISPDFQLSQLAFDAVAHEIGELPPTVVGQVVLSYHRFDHLRRLREMFGERTRRWREAEAAGQGDVKMLKYYVVNVLDAFTVALDRALKDAQETLTHLGAIATLPKWREVSDTETAAQVADAEAERHERTKRLAARLEQPTRPEDIDE